MPREIRCELCGDVDDGPWGMLHDHMLCELCLDLFEAMAEWARIQKRMGRLSSARSKSGFVGGLIKTMLKEEFDGATQHQN